MRLSPRGTIPRTAGVPQAGIKGTDTLVFAVDILAAYAPRK
jgi:hypothetical protein